MNRSVSTAAGLSHQSMMGNAFYNLIVVESIVTHSHRAQKNQPCIYLQWESITYLKSKSRTGF